MTLPERIAYFRARAELSQRELAEKMGVDPSTVAHWEQRPHRQKPKKRGKEPREFAPSVPRDMQGLVDALGVSMVEFWAAKGARKAAA